MTEVALIEELNKKAKQAYKNDPDAKWVLFVKGEDGEYVAKTFTSDEEMNAFIDDPANKVPLQGLYAAKKGESVASYDPTPINVELDKGQSFGLQDAKGMSNDRLTTTLAVYSYFNKDTIGEVKPYAISYMVGDKTVTVGFESLEEAKAFIENNTDKIHGAVSFGVRKPGEKALDKAHIDVTSANSLSELKNKVAGMSEQADAKESDVAATKGMDEKMVAALDKLWRKQNPGKEPEIITGKVEPIDDDDKTAELTATRGHKSSQNPALDKEVLAAAKSARLGTVALSDAGSSNHGLPNLKGGRNGDISLT